MTRFEYDDGGRAAAGFRGDAGDCVTRAIAIATEQPYRVVYDTLDGLCQDAARLKFRIDGSNIKRRAGARTGIPRKLYEAYLRELGWIFHPTMSIGSGCQMHLRAEELPAGRLIIRVSKHIVAMIDGVIHDTADC